jgi:tripartite ATP-independent transporter DctP family solute receptor
MKRIQLASLFFCLVFAAAMAGPVWAQDTIELKLYWPLGKKSLQWRTLTKLMDGVEQRTEGKVKFKRYCCRALGGDMEAIEQVRNGAIDMIAVGVGVYGAYHPPINMIVLPYIFKDYDHVYRFVSSPHWYELTKGLEKNNIRPIININAGFRDVVTVKQPVRKVADVRGVKLKVGPVKPWITLWNVYGAVVAPMDVTEHYMAMKTGVVDGTEMSAMNIYVNKMYEVAKYYSDVKVAWIGPGVSMNLDRWKSLPKDIQDIIMEEARKASKWGFDEGRNQNEEAVQIMKDKFGLMEVDNVDKDDFRKHAEKAYETYKQESWYDQSLIDLMKSM